MLPTLGIDDDDAVFIVRDLESAFDIEISNTEASACYTVGEVFDLLKRRFDDGRRDGQSCAGAMAFYRLRRALAVLSPKLRLGPILAHYGWWALVPVATVPAARSIMDTDPGNFPGDCNTLGNLAKKVSILNFGYLAKVGARANDSDLWQALTEVIAQYSVVPPQEMRPEALLLGSQRKVA